MTQQDSNAYHVWDSLAAYYDEVNGINHQNLVEATTLKHGNRMLKLLEYFDYDPAQGPIVDLGCGTGNLCCYLGFLGYRVIGVDISEAMIAICNKKKDTYGLGNVRFIQKDALLLTKGDLGETIGFLYSKEGFSHFADARYMGDIFSHIFSLLPSRAQFVFEVFTELGIGVLVTHIKREFDHFLYEQGGLYDHATRSGYIDYAIAPRNVHEAAIKTRLPIFFWDTDIFQDLLMHAGFRNIDFFDSKVDVVSKPDVSTINLCPPSFLSETFLVKAQKI